MVVVAERGDQNRLAGQARQLHRRDGATPRGLLERRARMNHLAGVWHALHARELHPLDVAHDSEPRRRLHRRSLTHRPTAALGRRLTQ